MNGHLSAMRKIVFHIGYHKTGTTWLQQAYFPNHHGINCCVDSYAPWENLFLRYLVTTSERKFDPLRARDLLLTELHDSGNASNGNVNLISAERLSRHPFSGGYDNFRICERIKVCFPDAKIICVIRNQVEMISSVYKELVVEGYTGTVQALFGNTHWKTVGFDLEYYEYDFLIEKYCSLFSREQVLVLTYESMREDLDTFLNKICDFLEISYFPPNNGNTLINRSLPNWSLPLVRFMNRFRTSELNPSPLLNLDRRVHRIAFRLLTKMSGRSDILSSHLVDHIRNHYRASNLRLRQLIEADFSKYV